MTTEGKPAPPMPQMPASFTRASKSSREAVFQSSGGMKADAPDWSSATSRITASTQPPVGPMRGSTAATVPATGAWTFAEMKPLRSPMSWPLATASPFLTRHFAGAPRCWLMETTSCFGRGIASIGLDAARSLLYCGWTPPWNLNADWTVFMG